MGFMATSPHLSGARQSRLHPRSQCTSVTVHISRHICPSAHLSAHRSQCTSVPVHVWFSARLSHRHLSVHIWLVAISLCTSRSSPSLCAHLARRYLSVRICLVAISQCTSSCRHFLVHICLPLSLSPPVSVLVSSLSMPLSRRLCSPPGTYVDLYTVELLASVTPQVPLRSDPTTSLMLASPSLFLAVR